MTTGNWAEVTAQTNYTRAANYARQWSWREAGIRKKKWYTMNDGRVRPDHELNEGQVVGIDESFPGGDFAPGEVPNCRCWMEIPDDELRRIGAL
jgi:SPP1 gp7 family putative phage head morphogenesis protein